MKKQKILESGEKICLFCGKPMQEKYEEYIPYFLCDCKDAKKIREIENKIRELKLQLPEHKFEIVQKNILFKLDP